MTTCAYDGKTLAADSMQSNAGMRRWTDKLRRIDRNRYVVTGAGDAFRINLLAKWTEQMLTANFEIDPTASWPDYPGEKDAPNGLMVEVSTGRCWNLDGSLWLPVSEPYFAIGSGRDYAMGAMAHGATAIEAVNIAAKHDAHSGGEVRWVDVLRVEEEVDA
jgi:ATP-dependent protease HslVU (ClpYQ) peptidase subunit